MGLPSGLWGDFSTEINPAVFSVANVFTEAFNIMTATLVKRQLPFANTNPA